MSIFSKKKPEEPQNIDEILAQFKSLQKRFSDLSEEMKALKKESIGNLKHFGIVRFNPFSDTGGNQSFSAAVLDGEKNGLVITSLFMRNENRVYGKPIKNGTSSYPLTDEEKEAIAIAINIEKQT